MRNATVLVGAALALAGGPAASGAIVVNATTTGSVLQNVNDNTLSVTTSFRAGRNDSNNSAAGIAIFALPTLITGESFSLAELSVTASGTNSNITNNNLNTDLYGLGGASSGDIQTSYFYEGPASEATSTDGVLIDQAMFTPALQTATVVTPGDDVDLGAYLNGLYNADGTPVADFVVFRLNPDQPDFLGGRYNLSDAVLSLTVIPEPASGLIAMAALGLLGLRRTR